MKDFGDGGYNDMFGSDWSGKGKGRKKAKQSQQSFSNYEKCYMSHQPIVFKNGAVLHGGSCSYPKITNAQAYIGLDYSAKPRASYPWVDEKDRVVDVYMPIPDMKTPTKEQLPTFKQMIEWACNQLQAGQVVHVGCIGGHGRTGMVLTAILAILWRAYGPETNVESDAASLAMRESLMALPDQTLLVNGQVIQWLRKHYCSKAVETLEQVEFLMDHYKVQKAPGAKTYSKSSGTSWDKDLPGPRMDLTPAPGGGNVAKLVKPGTYPAASATQPPLKGVSTGRYINPVKSKRDIWS